MKLERHSVYASAVTQPLLASLIAQGTSDGPLLVRMHSLPIGFVPGSTNSRKKAFISSAPPADTVLILVMVAWWRRLQ